MRKILRQYSLSFAHGLSAVTGLVHFAAVKSVSETIKAPLEYYKNNVSGRCKWQPKNHTLKLHGTDEPLRPKQVDV